MVESASVVEVRWADDGSRTGVAFDPLTVNRVAVQGIPPRR
ncbi:hypothetical protein ACWGJT_36010 [Streptomyces xantholiticus]